MAHLVLKSHSRDGSKVVCALRVPLIERMPKATWQDGGLLQQFVLFQRASALMRAEHEERLARRRLREEQDAAMQREEFQRLLKEIREHAGK